MAAHAAEYSHRRVENYGATSDYDLAPNYCGFESVMENNAQIHGFVNYVNYPSSSPKLA